MIKIYLMMCELFVEGKRFVESQRYKQKCDNHECGSAKNTIRFWSKFFEESNFRLL